METNTLKPNRLIHEKSPYLLQHAYNPVDWYPWGEEAFRKAREEGKPVFLSVGYSTCHWCHVMAHESFEDPGVASLINDAFIPVKVDREERPDVDAVYMAVCQLMTGGGGWPLTVVMTPEGEPFFAGTYMPKEGRFGHPGLMKLIPRLRAMWVLNRAEALAVTRKVVQALKQESLDMPASDMDEPILARAFEQLRARFDEEYGGFGRAPKFPSPHNLLFLLRYWKRSGNEKALSMAEKTLESMGMGGVYDHLGFGFHRYSTDNRWLVPHFEKMLYDQALLSMAYVEAYQATGRAFYRQRAEEIFTYVLRDMTLPGGGFCSAEDADSEGEEGKYYVWTGREIEAVLGGRKAELFKKIYHVKDEGNFHDEVQGRMKGENILHLSRPVEAFAEETGLHADELLQLVEESKKALFEARSNRPRPHRDDKVLTDWNGLMIAALALGGRVLGEKRYTEAAERAMAFILTKLRTHQGRLLHRYCDGHAGIRAYLDDYSSVTWGLLELYESTFHVPYLREAISLNGLVIDLFLDREKGGFYSTPHDGEELLVRKKELYDGALPSGNSVMMLNLLKLARLTGDFALEEHASSLASAFSGNVFLSPVAYTHLMSALCFALGPSYEVVLAGDPGGEDTKAMLEELRRRYCPEKVVLMHPPDAGADELHGLAPFTSAYGTKSGKCTAYICARQECRAPVTEPAALGEFFGCVTNSVP